MNGAALRAMSGLQRHRGPDDQGIRLFSLASGRSAEVVVTSPAGDPAGFEGGIGFNRLSILDLSTNGHQPMANDDGTVFIALNGEIYNAFDHRPALEAAGFSFKSHSDTEVCLRLYEQHGFEGMLARLNGMFAIAIVDLRSRMLWLARDRLGIKPLYWCEANGALLFASEAKAFLAYPGFVPAVDEARLDEYLSYRYCAWDGHLLRGVRQVPPGCWMRVTPEGRQSGTYWTVPEGDEPRGAGLEVAAQELETRLERSVHSQLLSDRKVGCQLSGGVDSSVVNLLAVRQAGANLDAFSIIFADPRFSEERWIDEAARTAGVQSHRFTLGADQVIDAFERCTWHLDRPVTHPNSLGIDHLSRLASPHVTVLLSGEGADELLGGYNRYLWAGFRRQLQPFYGVLRQVPALGTWLTDRFGDLNKMDDTHWFLLQSGLRRLDLVADARPETQFAAATAMRRGLFAEGEGSFLRNCLKYDLRTYLVDLLIRQDKMTMAHSLENRVPFLDHELVEHVRGLPTKYLVRASPRLRQLRTRGTKILLRKVATRYFNDEFVYRPKVGFTMPLAEYFRHPRFRELMEDAVLPGMRTRGLLQAPAIEKLWRQADTLSPDAAEALWSFIALEVWARQFVDGKGAFAQVARA